MIRKVILLVVLMALSVPSYSQENQVVATGGPKKQISKIFLMGLGGAMLGLSTLSFHGQPENHLENIAYGFALGILFGTIYITYDTTQDPQKLYSEYDLGTQRKFEFKTANYSLTSYTWTF